MTTATTDKNDFVLAMLGRIFRAIQEEATITDKDDFIHTQKILRLATISSDRMPHIVPVWYKYESGIFYIGTNTKSKKARNIMQNSQVSFCIDTGVHAPDIFGVAGNGTARLILNETVKPIAKKILSRYYNSLDNPSAQELLNETDCIIEITQKNITTWKY